MISFEPTTNAQEWRAIVELVNDETGEPYDLTGFGIAVELRDRRGTRVLPEASLSSGHITLTATGFQLLFPLTSMRTLRPGTYTVNGQITAPTGEVVQPFVSSIGITEGGFK